MYGFVYGYFIFMVLGGVVVEIFNFYFGNWYMEKVVMFLGYFYIFWISIDRNVYNIKIRLIIIFVGILMMLLKKVIFKICDEKY